MTDKLKPQDADFLMLSRRRFLKWGLCAAAITATLPAAAAIRDIPAERSLSFYNIHTGEYLKPAYRVQGELNTDALADIDHFMRDYRNGEVKIIDHELLDLLYSLNQHLRSARPFHVISGYRSPAPTPCWRRGRTVSPNTACTWKGWRWTSTSRTARSASCAEPRRICAETASVITRNPISCMSIRGGFGPGSHECPRRVSKRRQRKDLAEWRENATPLE